MHVRLHPRIVKCIASVLDTTQLQWIVTFVCQYWMCSLFRPSPVIELDARDLQIWTSLPFFIRRNLSRNFPELQRETPRDRIVRSAGLVFEWQFAALGLILPVVAWVNYRSRVQVLDYINVASYKRDNIDFAKRGAFSIATSYLLARNAKQRFYREGYDRALSKQKYRLYLNTSILALGWVPLLSRLAAGYKNRKEFGRWWWLG